MKISILDHLNCPAGSGPDFGDLAWGSARPPNPFGWLAPVSILRSGIARSARLSRPSRAACSRRETRLIQSRAQRGRRRKRRVLTRRSPARQNKGLQPRRTPRTRERIERERTAPAFGHGFSRAEKESRRRPGPPTSRLCSLG
jgi:hypothetical protein